MTSSTEIPGRTTIAVKNPATSSGFIIFVRSKPGHLRRGGHRDAAGGRTVESSNQVGQRAATLGVMPWFLPLLTATATAAFARKIIARYWHGTHAQHAQADPPGLRTVARFSADSPTDVMQVIAKSLGRDLEVEIVKDAIRGSAEGGPVDIVRLAKRAQTWTVELTRAWTGVYLGEQTRHVLQRIDVALRSAAREIAWFARQDRELTEPYATPYDEQALASR